MASKYKDPAVVACPECAARSSHRVATLLALHATCPNCRCSLTQIGSRMRNGLDEWATYVAAIITTVHLQERLGTTFTDDEVDGVKTLRDLAAIVVTRLEQTDQPASQSTELATWAVSELERDPLWCSRPRCPSVDGPLDFDAPLLDVVDSGRWERI